MALRRQSRFRQAGIDHMSVFPITKGSLKIKLTDVAQPDDKIKDKMVWVFKIFMIIRSLTDFSV